MKHASSFCLFALLVSPALAQTAGTDVPRQVVIRLQGDASPEALAQPFGAQVIASYPAKKLYVLQAPQNYSPANTQAMRAQLQNDPRVSAAEQNRFITSPEGTTQSFFVYAFPQLFPTQPSHERINAPGMSPAATGGGVRLAVLDTGVSTHTGISNQMLPGYNFIESTINAGDVGNGVDDDSDGLVDELTGHGTFVTGVAGLLAPNAAVIPVKVLNSDGIGTTFSVAGGIYFAADAGADIINLSFAAPVPSTVVGDAVTYASNRGIAIIAAAGNGGSAQPQYPAASPGVLAVAATDLSDYKAGFSNYGTWVDVSAPGVNVIGTLPGDLYAYASGTSFAAAWVSGVLAAGGTLENGTPKINPSRILQTAADLTLLNPDYVGQLGAGRLDAAAAYPRGCGTADFNGDGDSGTDQDIEAFFACIGGSCCASCFSGGSDFNADGDSGTDQDIESFFRVLGGGNC
ncbi:MAG TPA: S8 family serine peptidase [Phycisphaerales bacterium]|nr:S8 family serine peptidase [Phycisphaerales bacterium]